MVGQRHAQLLGLDAVDVGEQLRHVDLVAGEHAGQRLSVCHAFI
jgi:hypothetical protein